MKQMVSMTREDGLGSGEGCGWGWKKEGEVKDCFFTRVV